MDSVAYHGEVWTDGSGFATVRLPNEAGPLEPPLEYELRDLEPPSSARVTADTWVSTSMQYVSDSTMRCNPRT